MSKITSKLQITIPKAVAEEVGLKPGDDVAWEVAGDVIRLLPGSARSPALPAALRLELFDAATERQRARQRRRRGGQAAARGWTREELYTRGRAG